jgi:hypothetical protein
MDNEDTLLEQKINIKFVVKFKKNATDNYKMLQQVYGDRTW